MSPPARVLVVDADPELRATVGAFLQRHGHEVVEASTQAEAETELGRGGVALVLAEVATPKISGLGLLEEAQRIAPGVPVVLMSRYGNAKLAMDAVRRGASDYLTKPLELEELREAVERSLGEGAPRRASRRRGPTGEARFAEVVGQCRWREEALRVIEKVAPSRATVLLSGESGTGKELIARAIHAHSPRARRAFIAVACAALSRDLLESELFGHERGAFTDAYVQRPGRFELADGGTLFLDEIAEIPLDLQVKLLRVLQERSFERVGGGETINVDVRIVVATNQDLEELVEQGRFREDLFYRLQVVELTLPPLRERKGDIALLAAHFVRKYRGDNGKGLRRLSDGALETLQAYDWPGNVRELENAIEHAVVMAEPDQQVLEADLLPARVREGNGGRAHPPAGGQPLGETIRTVRQRMIEEAMAAAGGEVPRAAELLGISVRSLRVHLAKQGERSAARDGTG